MRRFAIAAAQFGSKKGDIESNLRNHVRFVQAAVENDVDVVVFPELSLTGYEPQIADELTLIIDDRRLAPLRELTARHTITIVAGAPVASAQGKPYIGALVFRPEDSFIYLKQHLHKGEDRFFVPGEAGCVMDIKGERVGLAICADINEASHPESASREGASIYAAGVLITPEGYSGDADLLMSYALKYNMLVVMANFSEPTGGYETAGKSAVWDGCGRLIAVARESGNALVLAEKEADSWRGRLVTGIV